jgi:hypothetical protein
MIETDSAAFPFRVEDLDADWLLALAEDAEVQSRRADRRRLRYAYQWCVLNPATEDTGRATWSELGREALDCDEAIGGEGTPLVAAFAAEQFGAALRVSTSTALQLMADALNLCHRLPRIWARVEALDVPAWRAQRVARATARLSRAAAAYVDRRLVGRISSCGAVTIDRAVEEAKARFEPEEVADAQARVRVNWHVRLSHAAAGSPDGWAGTSWLEASGDTLDLTRFHDLVCAVAEQLKAAGDEDDLEIRKAKALGVIADRAQGIESPGKRPAKTRLYLHVGAEDLDTDGAVGTAERLGPATLARIGEWLGGSRATILPVLDMRRTDAVDRHDPPEWMRELVILRDRHCVFPWCERDARACDLDHLEPYDEEGPPGQTRPDNLAPLCRRHHRCKTSGRWRYRRRPDGSYEWSGPHGRRFLVTPTDTTPMNPN